MKISYKKLKILMTEYEVRLQDLHYGARVSWGTISKIHKDEYMTLKSLIKMCVYMSKISGKDLGIDDLIEFDRDE